RYDLARQLGRIKRTRGLSIRDHRRELTILNRVGRIAEADDLPRERVRRIFREIMNIAVNAQRLGDRRHDLRGFQVLIAGGTGAMGRLFANTLANRGASVKIFGRNLARNKEIADELGLHAGSYSDARQADLVIVSVPIAATLEVAKRLASIMPPNS